MMIDRKQQTIKNADRFLSSELSWRMNPRQLEMVGQKIEDVKDTIIEALHNDAAHHKQWYLWRIAEALGLDLSDQWSEECPKPEDGIAP